MFKKLVCVYMFGLLSSIAVAQASSPVGRWIIIDDKTGEKRADVDFTIIKGELTGTIVNRYLKPGDPVSCISCPGEFKDKPIQGLQFIWGLKDEGNGTWGDGKLIDPKTGKIYRLKVSVINDKLHVRGYIGLALIGRTQVWEHKG